MKPGIKRKVMNEWAMWSPMDVYYVLMGAVLFAVILLLALGSS